MAHENQGFPSQPRLRVLFVCGRNQWRSPTAERIYRDDPRIEPRSAGVSPAARRRVSVKDLSRADLVLVMERKHGVRIREQFRDEPDLPQIESLDVPDEFEFMDPELMRLIREGVEEWVCDETDGEAKEG